MSESRSWLPLGVATGILALTLGAIALTGGGDPAPECATKVEATGPLLAPDRFSEDPRLKQLATSVGAMGAPFGEVVAGVGYDYDQWLRLYGVEGGLLAFTKNNAPVTYLRDGDLEPGWSLRPARKRTAWDADSRQFVLLGLAKGKPTQVSAYDLENGDRNWCVELPMKQADGEPVSTAFIADGADLIVALPGGGSAIKAARLSAADGGSAWSRRIGGVDRADFVGMLPDDLFVAGGSEEHRLAEPGDLPARAAVSAFSIADGRKAWGWEIPAGAAAHIAGQVDDQVLVIVRDADGSALVALDPGGVEVWRRDLPGYAFQSTLRSGVLITRTTTGLQAYDARTGEARWGSRIPPARTYFPYGFTLDQMPSLDDKHVLMPTTTALRVLDIRTGTTTAYPLPVDGVSTTYWPYQLAVTPESIAVVTNTGGVVAHRE